MVDITVTDRSGVSRSIDVEEGLSLMEALRENGFSELQAMCGGSCSCATCHVYLEPFDSDDLPPISEDENDLLDGSDERRPNSRLSCQVPLTKAAAGLAVTIAPED